MAITSLQPLFILLHDALHRPVERGKLLREFQRVIWNTPEDHAESWAWEILRGLAYDLDFYEPDATMRSEDPSYFGDERVEEEIQFALKRLKEGGLRFPLKED